MKWLLSLVVCATKLVAAQNELLTSTTVEPSISISATSAASSAASSAVSSAASSGASSAASSAASQSLTSAPSSASSSSVPSISISNATSAASTSAPSSASASVSASSALPSTSAAAPNGTNGASFPFPSLGASVPRNLVPIVPFDFTPFPIPSHGPISAVYIPTDPLSPPPVFDPSSPVASSQPPVIPDFKDAWDIAYTKAQQLISTFTLEEKVNVTTGVGWQGGRCVGNTPPIEGKGFPGLCLEDSPLGVRFADYVTAFPTALMASTTWNRKLLRLRGLAMGKEHKGKGVNIALGPMMNMGRVAQGGRNWEGFGADPYLAGEAAYETILGMQEGGVQACAKHFIFNEQEHKRTTTSSYVDSRTTHEIYGHPFLRSVMAGVGSFMCSYNLINGTYACEDSGTINSLLKSEYGFRGFMMSDWQATLSTFGSVWGGLDMTMPGDVTFNSGDSYFGGNLTTYVRNGTIPEERVDDMATRIVAAWYLLHQDSPSYPPTNFNAFNIADEATNDRVNVQEDHYKIVREIGRAGIVLLKNEIPSSKFPHTNTDLESPALPLTGNERAILVAGLDAAPQSGGPNMFGDQGGNEGILAMGWGSGTANFPYLVSPYEALQHRAISNGSGTLFDWQFNNFNLGAVRSQAARKDAALVFINSDSGEQYITVDGNEGDRKNLTAWHGGDALVQAVASVNPNTIVIVHSVGPLILEPWIDHPNVTAVLWAGVAGQEAGNAVMDVLYGDFNPQGRLPFTIAKSQADYDAAAKLLTAGQETPAGTSILSIPYNEGLLIDYRWFDAHNVTPRFEFGFGLSYTSFDYSDLSITALPTPDDGDGSDADAIARWEAGVTSLPPSPASPNTIIDNGNSTTPSNSTSSNSTSTDMPASSSNSTSSSSPNSTSSSPNPTSTDVPTSSSNSTSSSSSPTSTDVPTYSTSSNSTMTINPRDSLESGTAGTSTAPWLHRPAYLVQFTITNTGSVPGGEIPQLYLSFPPESGEPPRVLRGFANVDDLAPGESKQVGLWLSRYDLSVWESTSPDGASDSSGGLSGGGWKKGADDLSDIVVVVGASSRDERLRGSVPSL